MKRRLLVSLIAVFVLSLAVAPTFAYPVTPYSADGSAENISATLTIDVPIVNNDPTVSISVGALDTAAGGSNGDPHTTAGLGNGLNVDLLSGILNEVEVDLINVASEHTLGDPEVPDTDSESLINQNTILVDLDALGVSTSSFAQATDSETAQLSSIAGLVIHGDTLGLTDLLSTDAITGTIDNHTEGLGAESISQNRVDGLSIDLPLGLATIISAEALTTTSTAFSDGTIEGASATVDHEFVNLIIQGEDYSDVALGTVVPLIGIGGVDIGSVIIGPVSDTTVTPGMSLASGVALRIHVDLVSLLELDADIGVTEAMAAVESRPPTAVTLGNVDISAGQNMPYALLALGALGVVVTGTIVARRRSR